MRQLPTQMRTATVIRVINGSDEVEGLNQPPARAPRERNRFPPPNTPTGVNFPDRTCLIE